MLQGWLDVIFGCTQIATDYDKKSRVKTVSCPTDLGFPRSKIDHFCQINLFPDFFLAPALIDQAKTRKYFRFSQHAQEIDHLISEDHPNGASLSNIFRPIYSSLLISVAFLLSLLFLSKNTVPFSCRHRPLDTTTVFSARQSSFSFAVFVRLRGDPKRAGEVCRRRLGLLHIGRGKIRGNKSCGHIQLWPQMTCIAYAKSPL